MMKNPDRWIAGAGGLVSLVTLFSLWFSGVWHLGTRLGAVEAGIEGAERRLEARVEGAEQRLEARIDGVMQQVAGVDRRLDGVERRLDGADVRLLSIEETLRERNAVSVPGGPGMPLDR
ncbi:hypothetical protein [Candidatus Palauibacter sp.]|uniref:hypothetical protein n=1 Tax=Candidatus Palauibacter sp. TaxID=3101350 RepID=UPI003B5B8E80